jgi:hypothetical protein
MNMPTLSAPVVVLRITHNPAEGLDTRERARACGVYGNHKVQVRKFNIIQNSSARLK